MDNSETQSCKYRMRDLRGRIPVSVRLLQPSEVWWVQMNHSHAICLILHFREIIIGRVDLTLCVHTELHSQREPVELSEIAEFRRDSFLVSIVDDLLMYVAGRSSWSRTGKSIW